MAGESGKSDRMSVISKSDAAPFTDAQVTEWHSEIELLVVAVGSYQRGLPKI